MRYEDLTSEAQLNEDCDKEAKERMRSGEETTTRPKPIAGSKAMLYLKNNLVTTKMEEQIQQEAHEKKLKEYIKNKYEWTDVNMDSINWKAVGHAKRRLKLNTTIRISKFMHEWLNIGKQNKKLTH